jgi:hypothetical protein
MSGRRRRFDFLTWRNRIAAIVAAGAISIFAARASAQTVLGPDNPGAENGNTNWFTGTSGTGHSTIDTTDPATGTQDFELGVDAGGGNGDWRSASFLLGAATNGAQTVDFSFKYKLLNAVNAGDNMRVQLRFFQTNAGGIFLGEQNVLVGAATGDSSMNAYRLSTTTGITVPANAHSADIRFSGNLFEPWTSGTGRFDDFSVTTAPEPASLATLGVVALGLLTRRRRDNA